MKEQIEKLIEKYEVRSDELRPPYLNIIDGGDMRDDAKADTYDQVITDLKQLLNQ